MVPENKHWGIEDSHVFFVQSYGDGSLSRCGGALARLPMGGRALAGWASLVSSAAAPETRGYIKS
jgi:hypothetical protein